MSGQGVRTHHRRMAEHGLFSLLFIRTTYPDRICYRPGCDDRECRVLLPKGVRIGERATCSLGELGWSCSADIPPGCLTSGILLRRHSTRMYHIRNSTPPTFHPNILHLAPDAGWERRTDAGWKRRTF